MANLGADFNASKPSDADFVRHPTKPNLATEIRFIRARLKSFFDVLFNLDDDASQPGVSAGDFRDSVIPNAAIVDHPNKPSSRAEFFTKVTVDKRGFVIGGSTEPVNNAPRIFRACYTVDGGWYETADGLLTDPNAGTVSFPVGKVVRSDETITQQAVEYRFTVPAKATRLRVLLIGGGQPGGTTTSGAHGRSAWFPVTVSPGEIYKVQVAQSRGISLFGLADWSRYITSEGYNLDAYGPGSGYNTRPSLTTFQRPPYLPYGLGGDPYGTGHPGLVLIEWYA
jgi:hypothetical protein